MEAEGHAKYHEQTHVVAPSGLHISQRTNRQLIQATPPHKGHTYRSDKGQKGWEQSS